MINSEPAKALDAPFSLEEMSEFIPGALYQLKSSPDGSLSLPFGSVRYYMLMGVTVEQVAIDPLVIIRTIHPEDAARIVDAMAASRTHLTQFCEEWRMVRANGDVFWISGISTPRRLPDGSTVWCGHLSDITERKNIEQQLARSKIAAEAAHAANLAKSMFIANMSHELRTPLNAIIGYTEMVLEDLEAENHEGTARHDLQRVTAAGKHLLSLISTILDFAKIESGHVETEIAVFNPCGVAGDAVSMNQPLASKSQTALIWRGAADIGEIRSDAQKLKQCLINLISNACKFTQNGMVEVRVERASDDGRELIKFSIMDNGIGMSAEQIENLFQPFHQADSSITKRFGGTGLGLTITREIARLLGGDVWFESELGEGTVAYLTVAADLTTVAKAKPRSAGAPPPAPTQSDLTSDIMQNPVKVMQERLTETLPEHLTDMPVVLARAS